MELLKRLILEEEGQGLVEIHPADHCTRSRLLACCQLLRRERSGKHVVGQGGKPVVVVHKRASSIDPMPPAPFLSEAGLRVLSEAPRPAGS